MEPTQRQFSSPNIYVKGGDDSGLKQRAVQEGIDRVSELRQIGPEAQETRDKLRGRTAADMAVNAGVTVEEASYNPDAFGGPMSGSELAKFKAKKVRVKRDNDNDKKRR